MSEKRRDNKGRILKTGESQRTDGRYLYKYTDTLGEPQSIYSWKLVSTDRVPAGKRDCISLREKEQEIRRDIDDGIDTVGKKLTLCQLYAKQTAQRSNVKKSTQEQRKYLMRLLKHDKLGNKSIDSIKPSDAKEWAVRMKEKGYSYQSINNFKRSLIASFYTAIENDYVRKNPFNFLLNTVIEDDRKAKVALTQEQEETLLSFAKSDKTYRKYYDVIVLLLNTGLRISEMCGLTVNDLDFENRLINVDHQLTRNKEIGYYIETPKTKSGIRKIPMSDKACQALQSILSNRKNVQPLIIDGYSDFLFLNNAGYPVIKTHYCVVFKNLVKKYNKHHEDKLPNITPHILRHTFCTRLANKNMNPKSLQYIMGHSNINITMNLYAHASIEGLKSEMINMLS